MLGEPLDQLKDRRQARACELVTDPTAILPRLDEATSPKFRELVAKVALLGAYEPDEVCDAVFSGVAELLEHCEARGAGEASIELDVVHMNIDSCV
ncbi:MAG: hypothetical protein WDA16_07470 [Candidatus Thermoplasmatota archaeon]